MSTQIHPKIKHIQNEITEIFNAFSNNESTYTICESREKYSLSMLNSIKSKDNEWFITCLDVINNLVQQGTPKKELKKYITRNTNLSINLINHIVNTIYDDDIVDTHQQ